MRTICPAGQTKVAIPETLDFVGIVTERKVSKKQYKNNFGRIQSNTDFPVDCYSFEHKKPVFGLLFGHCGSIINFVKVYPNWKKITFPMGIIVLSFFTPENQGEKQRGEILMKKHLQLILALLSVLALVLGTAAATAEETEPRTITVVWDDGDNIDKVRPTEPIMAELAGQSVELNEGNGWTGEVTVQAGTGNDWVLSAVAKYAYTLDKGPITVATYHYSPAPLIDVPGYIEWNDDHNAKGIRPAAAALVLYADGVPYGEPKEGAKTVKWTDLPSVRPGTNDEIVYTVKPLKDPAGYTGSASGTEVTFTLNTVNVSISATVAGAPEGTDLSGLRLIVDGPDPDMPRTLSWADVSGGYQLTGVLPGAYLIRDINADTLVEGYVMDKDNSKVCDAAYIAEGTGTLSWKYTYKEPTPYEEEEGYDEEEYAEYDPWGNVGALTFEILGPDARMPMTVTLASFKKDGDVYRFEDLPDLEPGVYTVVERNAERLVKYYTLTSDSKTALKLEVTAGGTATAMLYNQYVPAPTPEPEAEFVDVPVTKTWNDNNNKDGNRPAAITVRLYADGVEVASQVLTADNGWKFTFTQLPRYQDDKKTEIVYSVNEDDVTMYTKEIKGYNIINHYSPEVTSRSVAKVWMDNNDEQKARPASIYMTLKDNSGKTVAIVVLNEANNWFATVGNLPTTVNGQKAVYSWSEQEVIGYTRVDAKEEGSTLTFYNAIWKRPDEPGTGKKPKTRGTETITLDDYDTPLGVDVIINHVGDCFD